MGVIGACSHGLLILAFDAAEAGVLSPLLYTEIIMQVLGFACFATATLSQAWDCSDRRRESTLRASRNRAGGDAGSGSVIGSSGSGDEHSGNRSGCQRSSAEVEVRHRKALRTKDCCAAADCATVTQATEIVAEAREEPVPVVHEQVTLNISPPRS